MYNVKANGIQITNLKVILKEYVKCSPDLYDLMMEKMNNHQKNKLTWTEFCDWLMDAGERREIGNEAIITNFGTTRITQSKLSKIMKKDENKQNKIIDFTIEKMTILDLDMESLQALVVFENLETYIFNVNTFTIAYKFEFPSDYTIPKRRKKIIKKEKEVREIVQQCNEALKDCGDTDISAYVGANLDQNTDIHNSNS